MQCVNNDTENGCVCNSDKKICGRENYTPVNSMEEPLNHEEGYNRVKKENEELKEYNIKTTSESVEIKFKNEELAKENEELKEKCANMGTSLSYRELQAKQEQIETQNKTIDNYSIKITILEQDNKEYEKANEGLATESQEKEKTIKKLQRLIEDNSENVTLRNRIEDLENINKDINNTRELIHEELIKLANENTELKEEKEGLKKAIQEGIEGVKECREVLQSKNKSIEAFGEAAAKDKARIDHLEKFIVQLPEEKDNCDIEIQELKKRINKYQEYNETIEKKLENEQIANKIVDDETEKLKAQANKLRESIKTLASLL